MKKLLILIFLATALTGCTLWDTVQTTVAVRGADAADETLEAALWTVCNATPVGAINRRFKTGEEIAAYRLLCPSSLAAPVMPPSN